MPSITHETLVDLFRDCPALAPELLRRAGLDLGGGTTARVTAAAFTDLDPAEYRADVVIRLDLDDAPVEAVIVEIQLDRDVKKRTSWPLYVAGAYARFGCPVTLLVVAIDDSVAAWCARPIPLDHNGSMTCPVVLGPRELPRITDVDHARALPELAVLSAAAHGAEEDAAELAVVALSACQGLDNKRATRYADFVMASLGEVARRALESFMSLHQYEYQSEFAKKYVEEGSKNALREVLSEQLAQRFGDLSEALRARIDNAETDDLERWTRRIIPAATLADVFRDD